MYLTVIATQTNLSIAIVSYSKPIAKGAINRYRYLLSLRQCKLKAVIIYLINQTIVSNISLRNVKKEKKDIDSE